MEPNANAAPAISPGARRTLGLVFLTVFMDFLGFSIIFPILPSLLSHYIAREPAGTLLHTMLEAAENIAGGGDRVAVLALFGGILGALFSALQFVFAPLWGRLSDRIGRRPVLLITLTGTALSYLLWMFSGAFWVLVLSRVVAGVMAGNISVASAAAADCTEGRDRSKAMALVGIAIASGMLFGPAIGGVASMAKFAGSAWSGSDFALNPFSLVAGIAFALALLNVVVARLRFPETLPPEKRSLVSRRGSIFALAHLPADIRRAALVNLLFFMAFAGMESTLTFAALGLFGYDERSTAWMFVFIAISLILVQGGLVRRIAPRVGEKRMAIAGLVAGVIAFVIIAVIPKPEAAMTHGAAMQAVFFVGLFFFALASGMSQPSLSALVSLYSDERSQGFHAGVFRSGGALARAVGPFCAALIYFRSGAHTGVFVAGAALTFAPLLLAFRLRQPPHAKR